MVSYMTAPGLLRSITQTYDITWYWPLRNLFWRGKEFPSQHFLVYARRKSGTLFVYFFISVSMAVTMGNVRKRKCPVATTTILWACWRAPPTTWSEESAIWSEKVLVVSRRNSAPAAGFRANELVPSSYLPALSNGTSDVGDETAICYGFPLVIYGTNRALISPFCSHIL